MINISRGNIFAIDCDCIVNTVNCVGFMGKGIALEISIRYPDLENRYIAKCKNKEINIGKLWLYNAKGDSKKVLNFPTKDNYIYPSKIEYLKKGLETFCQEYRSYKINSIAFPLLGAQNGKISPESSLSIMKEYLDDLEDITINICIFDHNNYQKDELFKTFLYYLDDNVSDKKIARIREILSSRNDIYTFADMVDKKVSAEQEDGSIKRSSIATKKYLQKIITRIKQNEQSKQTSFFDFPTR